MRKFSLVLALALLCVAVVPVHAATFAEVVGVNIRANIVTISVKVPCGYQAYTRMKPNGQYIDISVYQKYVGGQGCFPISIPTADIRKYMTKTVRVNGVIYP